jgi:threonine/homoserine/homoserine lactone efflux protein
MGEFFGVFGPVALLMFFGWASPGPNHLAILSASVGAGRAAGIATALGICTATLLWLSLAMGGVTALFDLFPRFLLVFRIAGAFFLFWLGYQALRSSLSPSGAAKKVKPSSKTGWRAYRTGFVVNATNPKAAIFFGTLLTAFVPHDGSWVLLASVVLTTTAMAVILNVFAAYMYSTKAVIGGFQAASKPLSVVFGLLFGALGIIVIWDALRHYRSV